MTSFTYKLPVGEEAFRIIKDRYIRSMATVNDPTAEPISVYDPLTNKQMQELELIRTVTAELQKRKEEDIKKAAEAKEEEVKKEEKPDEQSIKEE